MRESRDCELHGPADLDVNVLVGFLKVRLVDVEGSLNAGIVDQPVNIWEVQCHLLSKVKNSRDVAVVERVVNRCRYPFLWRW